MDAVFGNSSSPVPHSAYHVAADSSERHLVDYYGKCCLELHHINAYLMLLRYIMYYIICFCMSVHTDQQYVQLQI